MHLKWFYDTIKTFSGYLIIVVILANGCECISAKYAKLSLTSTE